jgi:hypothetical protein
MRGECADVARIGMVQRVAALSLSLSLSLCALPFDDSLVHETVKNHLAPSLD